MNNVVIYTDGACRGNPGPGGWAAILIYQDKEKIISGFESYTTNNRMELMAAVEGLKALNKKCIVELYTDSQYVKQGMSIWIHNWRRNAWMSADKKPIKNQDLWLSLDAIAKKHEVRWHWVKGHNGHEQNERADLYARKALDLGLEK